MAGGGAIVDRVVLPGTRGRRRAVVDRSGGPRRGGARSYLARLRPADQVFVRAATMAAELLPNRLRPPPGSAEMPSAARPFSTDLVTTLVADGIAIAPITLHAGVSSAEPGEPPVAGAVRRAARHRAAGEPHPGGGRTGDRGRNHGDPRAGISRECRRRGAPGGRAGRTWCSAPAAPCRVVDGLITGWHDAGASHLLLLEAVAGPELVAAAYREAVDTRVSVA